MENDPFIDHLQYLSNYDMMITGHGRFTRKPQMFAENMGGELPKIGLEPQECGWLSTINMDRLW